MSELLLSLADAKSLVGRPGGTTWLICLLVLPLLLLVALRWYFRRPRPQFGFWQFSLLQLVVLLTVWTLLLWAWMLRDQL